MDEELWMVTFSALICSLNFFEKLSGFGFRQISYSRSEMPHQSRDGGLPTSRLCFHVYSHVRNKWSHRLCVIAHSEPGFRSSDDDSYVSACVPSPRLTMIIG